MTKALNNYDKTKISMAHVFLQYDQATMIHKYSLDYNSDWLYITFINRTYRINRKTGSVQWSDNDFEIVHEANHNEAMTIYDVLCYSKDRCHLSHEFVNINSLSSLEKKLAVFHKTFDIIRPEILCQETENQDIHIIQPGLEQKYPSIINGA